MLAHHPLPTFGSTGPPRTTPSLSRFCLHLHNLLEDPAHRHQRIFLYSSDEPDKKVNAALLMSLYAVRRSHQFLYLQRLFGSPVRFFVLSQMVVMRWSVADVLHPISCLELVSSQAPSILHRPCFDPTSLLLSNRIEMPVTLDPTTTCTPNKYCTDSRARSRTNCSTCQRLIWPHTRRPKRLRKEIGTGSHRDSSRLRVQSKQVGTRTNPRQRSRRAQAGSRGVSGTCSKSLRTRESKSLSG